MRIGLDFDNTMICYDHVFYQTARERSLIPSDVPATKHQIRDYLRRCGREADWTTLQGLVYGARLMDAPPFPGVRAFLAQCRQRGIPVSVISHKTPQPVLGPAHDLHQAAHEWLARQAFYDAETTGLSAEQVYFEPTKQEKLARIRATGCTHFVDDLPEFLEESEFPTGVARILFDPAGAHPAAGPFHRVTSWDAITAYVLGTGTPQ